MNQRSGKLLCQMIQFDIIFIIFHNIVGITIKLTTTFNRLPGSNRRCGVKVTGSLR